MLFKIPGFAGLCHSSPINGYGFLPVTFEKAELQPKVLSSLTSSVPTQPTVHGSPGGFGLVPFFRSAAHSCLEALVCIRGLAPNTLRPSLSKALLLRVLAHVSPPEGFPVPQGKAARCHSPHTLVSFPPSDQVAWWAWGYRGQRGGGMEATSEACKQTSQYIQAKNRAVKIYCLRRNRCSFFLAFFVFRSST